jgi:hypothetical protein
MVAILGLACDQQDETDPSTITPSASPADTPEATASPARSPTERPTATATGPAIDESPVASPAALRWRELAPSGPTPPARRDHSLVTDGERVFLFGGRGLEVFGDTWVFDTASGSWSEITSAQGPPARFGHNAFYDPAGQRMLLFGGQAGSRFFNDIWALDVNTGRWTELADQEDLPAPRYGAAGAVNSRGHFLLSHGFTNAGRFDDTWRLVPRIESWTEVSPEGERPLERCLMRAVWDSRSERLLMFGGQSTGRPFLGDLWELADGEWRELTTNTSPSPRNFYAMAFDADAGRVVLYGGNTQDGPVSDVWFFDSASDSWTQPEAIGEEPSPRFGHDAVWLPGGVMLIFGGRDASGDLNDIWELEVAR